MAPPPPVFFFAQLRCRVNALCFPSSNKGIQGVWASLRSLLRGWIEGHIIRLHLGGKEDQTRAKGVLLSGKRNGKIPEPTHFCFPPKNALHFSLLHLGNSLLCLDLQRPIVDISFALSFLPSPPICYPQKRKEKSRTNWFHYTSLPPPTGKIIILMPYTKRKKSIEWVTPSVPKSNLCSTFIQLSRYPTKRRKKTT